MTEDLAAYLERYRLVAAFERAEVQALDPTARAEALAALMASVDSLELREALEEGDDRIWARWQTLRRRLGERDA